MNEPIRSIASRELAAWLQSHVAILEGESAKIRAIASDSCAVRDDCALLRMADAHLEHMRAVSAWLDDAKFEVRDPWSLCAALQQIATMRVTQPGPDPRQAQDILIQTLQQTAKAALETFKS